VAFAGTSGRVVIWWLIPYHTGRGVEVGSLKKRCAGAGKTKSRVEMTISRQAVCGWLGMVCGLCRYHMCVCVVCVCVCVLLLLLLLLLFVLRLNDVVAARSSAAFNNGNVDLVSAVVGGDVTPWCESAWLFGRLR
jgi:hypothetical protein